MFALVNLILAVVASFSLSVSPLTGPVGSDFKFHVDVNGPFVGDVCVAFLDKAETEIEAHFCPDAGDGLSLKADESKSFDFTLTAGADGVYHAKVVAITPDGPVFDPASVELVVTK